MDLLMPKYTTRGFGENAPFAALASINFWGCVFSAPHLEHDERAGRHRGDAAGHLDHGPSAHTDADVRVALVRGGLGRAHHSRRGHLEPSQLQLRRVDGTDRPRRTLSDAVELAHLLDQVPRWTLQRLAPRYLLPARAAAMGSGTSAASTLNAPPQATCPPPPR